MVYTQKQIKIIQNERPDLRFQRIPTLDDLIEDFLKRFDVIVTHPNYQINIFSNESDLNLVNFKNINQDLSKMLDNQIKEWEQWKKWALEHPDFESYRVSKIRENQLFNKKILDKLNSDEIKKEFNILFEEYKSFNTKRILLYTLIILAFIFSLEFLKLDFFKNNQKDSLISNLFNLEKLDIKERKL